MKGIYIFSIIAISILLQACTNSTAPDHKTALVQPDTSLQYYGDSITLDKAISATLIASKLEALDSIEIKLSGTIDEVCQKKGCWMNLDIGNNQTMKVRFKDYGFFVPKNAAGKTTYIEGIAFRDTTSIGELKHYAEDAGKSKEEIEMIVEPEINISFEAKGVIIKNH